MLRTLQIAIQAALDIASHIVSDQRLGEPESNRELLQKLADSGWVAPQLIAPMRDMAGFRNVRAWLSKGQPRRSA